MDYLVKKYFSDQIFLTYSNTCLEKETVLEDLKNRFPVVGYCISREIHHSGNQHIHVYLKFKKPLNIRKYQVFAISDNMGNKSFCHLKNVLKTTTLETLEYITKEDKDFLTNMDMDALKKVKLKKLEKQKSTLEEAYEIGVKHGLEKGMEFLLNSDPKATRRSYLNVKKNMEAYILDHRANLTKVDPLDSFVDCAETRQAKEWLLERSQNKVLCLVGKTEVGKTSYAMSLLHAQGLNPLLVNTLESLQKFSAEKHKALIFDDFNWSVLDISTRIHLLDLKFPYTISVKFGSRLIPAGTIKVVTCNDLKASGLKAYSTSSEEVAPIMRRLELLEVNAPLYKREIKEEKKVAETPSMEKRWTKSGVENDRLRGENERLKKENERLQKENEELKKANKK